jgi:hypothetical protein
MAERGLAAVTAALAVRRFERLRFIAMTNSTLDARIAFARNCLRGAQRAELTGQRRLAAELRGAASRALDGLGAAVAQDEPLNPHRSQTQAIAAAMLRALH